MNQQSDEIFIEEGVTANVETFLEQQRAKRNSNVFCNSMDRKVFLAILEYLLLVNNRRRTTISKTDEELKHIFDVNTANGMREMTVERFIQAVREVE